MKPLSEEFGNRLIALHTGDAGLRGGLTIEVKNVDAKQNTLRFIGSDGSVDRYHEVIDQKGWNLTNFKRNPVIPDCHDYSSIVKILGRAAHIEVNKDGQLVNDVEFCVENPLGNLAFKMAAGGFIKSQSVGFIPLEWTNGKTKDDPARTYTKAELLEISMVVVPANPGATLGLALKQGFVARGDLAAVADLLKNFCSATEPAPPVSPSGAGLHDGHLLNLARELRGILRR